jgi:hypothetical protein
MMNADTLTADATYSRKSVTPIACVEVQPDILDDLHPGRDQLVHGVVELEEAEGSRPMFLLTMRRGPWEDNRFTLRELCDMLRGTLKALEAITYQTPDTR